MDIDYTDPKKVNDFFEKAFPGIEPTARDLFDGKLYAFEQALKRKLKDEEQAKKIERIRAITAPWTPEEMYKRAFEYGKVLAAAEGFKNGFVIDNDNEFVFKLLCLYFCNDPRFESYKGVDGNNYDLRKGIWLQSADRGTGKSTLLRCFQFNKRCSFGYMHTSELGNKYQRGGYDKVDFFLGTIPQPSSASNFYQKEAGFMYDELFGDTKVNYMGTPQFMSEYIINKLYDFSNNRKGEMWKFHCTSNVTGEDIENISGKTYRSRMPDMFNLIKLNGPNRRLS